MAYTEIKHLRAPSPRSCLARCSPNKQVMYISLLPYSWHTVAYQQNTWTVSIEGTSYTPKLSLFQFRQLTWCNITEFYMSSHYILDYIIYMYVIPIFHSIAECLACLLLSCSNFSYICFTELKKILGSHKISFKYVKWDIHNCLNFSCKCSNTLFPLFKIPNTCH